MLNLILKTIIMKTVNAIKQKLYKAFIGFGEVIIKVKGYKYE